MRGGGRGGLLFLLGLTALLLPMMLPLVLLQLRLQLRLLQSLELTTQLRHLCAEAPDRVVSPKATT